MSKWFIVAGTKRVALGEMQQDGGVGGQLHDIDSQPEEEHSYDVGEMGQEQEDALNTWADVVHDLVSNGKVDSTDDLKERLMEQNCPFPDAAIDRYIELQAKGHYKEQDQQPQATPDLPQNPPEAMPGNMPPSPAQGAPNMQPQAKYEPHGEKPKKNKHIQEGDNPAGRDAQNIYKGIMREKVGPDGEGSDEEKSEAAAIAWDKAKKMKKKKSYYNGVEGKITDRWVDMYGVQMARFATAEGVVEVPLQAIESTIDVEEINNPIVRIEQFMDGMEPVTASRPSIMARIANLETIVSETNALLSDDKLPLRQQMKLDEINLTARLQLGELKETLSTFVSADDHSYISQLPQYEMQVVEQADLGHKSDGAWLDEAYNEMIYDPNRLSFQQIIDEEPPLLIANLPYEVLSDAPAVRQMAIEAAKRHTARIQPEGRSEFIQFFAGQVEHLRRCAQADRKRAMKKEVTALNNQTLNVPDEALFYGQ